MSGFELTISLVEDQKAQIFQSDLAPVDDVVETTGRGDNQVTAAIELTHLIAGVVATVQHSWAHARAVRELLSFLEDLRGQFARWGEHQAERILLTTIVRTIRWRIYADALLEHAIQNGNEKCGSFAVDRTGFN